MFFSTHNYKGYKKTKEDDKSATLQHPDGHSVVIAISALKPEHKKALKDLPLHMDEGGEVEDSKPEEPSTPTAVEVPSADTSTPTFGSDAAAGAMAAGSKGGGGGGGGGMAAMMGAEGGDVEPPYVRAENLLSQDKNAPVEPSKGSLSDLAKEAFVEALHKERGAPQSGQDTAQLPGQIGSPQPGGIMSTLPNQSVPMQAAANPQATQAPISQGQDQAANSLLSDDAPAEQPVNGAMAPIKELPNPDVTPQSLAQTSGDRGQQEQMAANMSPDAEKRAQLQQYATEDQAWSRDLVNGHVQPKTYSDLFNNKSTLGKVGMIFGMMMSGAGSGLAHQPNMLMDMMNKEIDRDYQGQVQSKSNAMNFVKANQEHQMQVAQINQMQHQGRLTDAQAKNLTIDSQIKAQTNARMQMNRVALHHLVTQVSRMPDGPQKMQATQQLGMLSQAVDAENYNLADVAASRSAFMNMSSGLGQGASSQGPVDYNRMNQLERASQMKIPGAPSESDIGAMGKEAAQVEENRALRSTYNDSFQKLNSMALAGKLSPHMRAAEINTLSAQMARQTAHRYNLAEATQQADGMFPQSGDWHSTREEKLRKANQFFDAEEAGTPTLNRFGLKRGTGGSPEVKTMGGVNYQKVPGGWQRMK